MRSIPCAAGVQRAEAEAGGEEARGSYVCRQGCGAKRSVPEVTGGVPRLNAEMFVGIGDGLELGCRMSSGRGAG